MKSADLQTKLLLTSLSATVSETATFPIDLTKTRLQLHGEVLRIQGVAGLYKGLSPAILRHVMYTAIRIVGYEQMRNLGIRVSGERQQLSLVEKAVIGGLSGMIAQVVASPADLMKVRVQAGSRLTQQRYSGTLDALTKIVKAEGVGDCGEV